MVEIITEMINHLIQPLEAFIAIQKGKQNQLVTFYCTSGQGRSEASAIDILERNKIRFDWGIPQDIPQEIPRVHTPPGDPKSTHPHEDPKGTHPQEIQGYTLQEIPKAVKVNKPCTPREDEGIVQLSPPQLIRESPAHSPGDPQGYTPRRSKGTHPPGGSQGQ
ncbi:hypothetical protein OS493_008650 [Desmophyllum pertusum]|uniref:Uncharacterized protein n=1 Tax=Desmophyllum pertusum TaxID=174260 RepID=A0A9W9ZS48_9CNID|nr:hypothetical protein OS493_008650 [Desmophyllum pertusum]